MKPEQVDVVVKILQGRVVFTILLTGFERVSATPVYLQRLIFY